MASSNPQPRPQRKHAPAKRPTLHEAPPSAESQPGSQEDVDRPAAAIITRRAAERLGDGHLWVYASDVNEIVAPERTPVAGLLPVEDTRGVSLGTALYSPTSQIALRLVSRELLGSEEEWFALLRSRLHAALERRRVFPVVDPDTPNVTPDACRLVFSEADDLPGVIADKYGALVIVQLLAHGLDRPEVRAVITDVLREELEPATIVERPDPRIRELEQLSAPSGEPLFAEDPEAPRLRTTFTLNGLRFHYDTAAGQKTGAFLDQAHNYRAAAQYAHGAALDVCTYQGGFALHLASRCPQVTGVDSSRTALEVADRNLELNRSQLGGSQVDWIEADAFALLRAWSDAGTEYGTVVLDPPAFAKSKRAAEGALRGYKELNLRALTMLSAGGVLVTCSCSHHISLADFTGVLAAAAADAGKRVQLLERRGAAPDHPVLLAMAETEYLKCLICRVE